MEPFSFGMMLQKEHENITRRVNRDAWMLETVDARSRAKIGDALLRRIQRNGG